MAVEAEILLREAEQMGVRGTVGVMAFPTLSPLNGQMGKGHLRPFLVAASAYLTQPPFEEVGMIGGMRAMTTGAPFLLYRRVGLALFDPLLYAGMAVKASPFPLFSQGK